MIFKYFIARTKRNIFLTMLGCLAMFFVCVALIIASAMPGVINSAITKYTLQLCGDADITITTPRGAEELFFSLTSLRRDGILLEHSEYINGYFMNIAEISHGDRTDTATFFAADFTSQQQYNPIIGNHLPESMTEGDIIIGENYARQTGIQLNDNVAVKMMGRIAFFNVVAIAENRGLFVSGNSIFISNTALRRFNVLFGSEIVTHGFIKAKDDISLGIIKQRLSTEHERLGFGLAVDTNSISEEVQRTMMPIAFVSIFVVIFCAFTLVVILRLTFTRDKKNFDLLRTIGLRSKHITAINALTSIIICVVGMSIAFMFSLIIENFISGMSFILSDARIENFSYVFAFSIGLIISFVCTILGSHERRPKKNKDKPVRKYFDPRIIFISSTALTVVSFLTGSSVVNLLFAIIGFIFVLISLPKCLPYLANRTHNFCQSSASLHLKTQAKSKDWQQFIVFIMIGSIIVSMLILAMVNARLDMMKSIQNFAGGSISLTNYLQSIFFEYLWIFNMLCSVLISLVAITVASIIMLRRLSNTEQSRRLVSLGHTRAKEIKHNMFSVSIALLPIFLLMPFLVYVVCHISALASTVLGMNLALAFHIRNVAILNVAIFLFLVITESLISSLVFKDKVK